MTWPTWITPPTRESDPPATYVAWDLSFGRYVSVGLRPTGWRVFSPEMPNGITYHHEEAADLAQYVEAQRIRPARVVLESPYAGNVEANLDYARRALTDSLRRGEAPIASHLLHTQVLADAEPDQRRLGIAAGHAWIAVAEAVVVYEDLGISAGMQAAIDEAERLHVPVERRNLFDTPGRPCQN